MSALAHAYMMRPAKSPVVKEPQRKSAVILPFPVWRRVKSYAGVLAQITLPDPAAIPARTSGVGPLYVFFDASATTATGVTNPFHELYYVWDFGDPAGSPVSGTTWTTGARAGTSRNIATGPVSGHVFENVGTFTVRLTVYDTNGNVESTTFDITVNDPATSYAQRHFFSNDTTYAAGTPADNGTTVFHHDSTTDFDAAIAANIAANRALYFEWGDTFTSTTFADIKVNGPGVIGANPYGSGTKPLIEMTGDTHVFGIGDRSLPDNKDWRLSDFEIDCNSGTSAAGVRCQGGQYGQMNQLLMLRLYIHHSGFGIVLDGGILDFWNDNGFPGHDCFSEIGIVDCVTANIVGGSSGQYSFYGCAERFAILGCDIDNDGGGSHTVRIFYMQKAVVANNRIAGSETPRHAFKIHAYQWTQEGVGNPGAVGTYSELAYFNNNRVEGAGEQWTAAFGPQDSTNDERVRHIVLDGNLFTAAVSNVTQLKIWATYVTVRNNLFNASGMGFHTVIGIEVRGGTSPVTPDSVWVYNNTFYSSDTDSDFTAVALDANVTNITLKNNLAYAPNDSNHAFRSGSGASGLVDSNNSLTANGNPTSVTADPDFASATPVNPADFQITAGSYGIQAGAESVPVFADFEGNIRNLNDMDMGFHAFTTGSLPGQTLRQSMSASRMIGLVPMGGR